MATPVPTPAITDFGGLATLRTSARAQDPAALRKAAQQFEALFTQQILKSARAASLSDDVLGGGQTAFYQDIFDQQMSLHLSSGKGIGLAEMLVRQMQGMSGVPAAPGDAPGSSPLGDALPGLRMADKAGPALPAIHAVPATPATAGNPAIHATPAVPATPASHRDGPAALTPERQAFVDELRPHAERAAKALGVPAHMIIAQAAIETGWGRHVPAKADGSPSHNYFGIKAGASWSGDSLEKPTNEFIDGRLQKTSATFRAYGSVGEAFDDYVSFLKSNPRYAQALGRGDAQGFAVGLQKAGYATDPAYSGKLLRVAHGPTMAAALSSPPSADAPRHRGVRTWTA